MKITFEKERIFPHLASFFAVVFLGINFVIVRGVYEQYPTTVLSLWRWGGAAVLLLLFNWQGVINEWALIKRNILIYSLLAFLMPISGALASFLAMEWTVAVNGAIIQTLIPVLVVLISFSMGLERVRAAQIIGLILALIGVLWIVTKADLGFLSRFQFNTGDLILLLSALSLAGYTVIYKSLKEKPKPAVFLTILCGIGGILHLPFVFFEIYMGTPMPLNIETSFSIIYVTVFPSLVAILLFNYGIDRLGPNKAAAYHYFLAPITAITAFLFIDERLMWYHGVGTVLIFLGVYMTANAKKRVSQK